MREALVYAIGIAISPVAIAAVLLLLTCRRAVANAVGFLAGWTIGVATLFVGFVVIVGQAGLTDSDPLWVAVVELALGTAFLLATMLLWKRRHRRSELDASWVAAVDSFTTARSAGLGVVLSGANPKVVALSFGAALALAKADAEATMKAKAVVLFRDDRRRRRPRAARDLSRRAVAYRFGPSAIAKLARTARDGRVGRLGAPDRRTLHQRRLGQPLAARTS